jgi:hypothetical protein
MSPFSRRLQSVSHTAPVVNGSAYPTAATTGVPAGTVLQDVAGDSDGNVTLTTNNQIFDGKHVSGALIIQASGVVVKNCQIDNSVLNWDNTAAYNFTIQDSTVGLPGSFSTIYAIGDANYTALRVHLHGHSDGFRVGGPQPVLIQDCFIELASNDPNDHSDGIQAYGAANNQSVVIRHNTIDQRAVPRASQTAPIFLPSGSNQGNDGMVCTIQNNLLASGSYSLRIGGGSYIAITGNKIVDGLYAYSPVDSDNHAAPIGTWSGNATVNYNWATGQVTSEVSQIAQP